MNNLIDLLVCPKCRGPLIRKQNPDGLACEACELVYPIEAEIPIMLIDRAIPRAEWEKKCAS